MLIKTVESNRILTVLHVTHTDYLYQSHDRFYLRKTAKAATAGIYLGQGVLIQQQTLNVGMDHEAQAVLYCIFASGREMTILFTSYH